MGKPSKWGVLLLLLCSWMGCALAAESPPGNPPHQQESSPPAAPQESPSIEIPQNTFDFGEAVEGSEVSNDFILKNTGKAVLQIEQVRPG